MFSTPDDLARNQSLVEFLRFQTRMSIICTIARDLLHLFDADGALVGTDVA